MEKYKPILKNNCFYHPPEFFQHTAESLLFGTIPSFAKAYLSRLFSSRQDPSPWIHTPLFDVCPHETNITWIGHATFLIESNGVRILTDPVFGDLSFFFRRLTPAGRTIEQLPRIDFVLLSHNHRDHMDAASLIALKKLNPEMQVLVPQGDKDWFARRGFSGVKEFGWWDEYLTPLVRFVFLPPCIGLAVDFLIAIPLCGEAG